MSDFREHIVRSKHKARKEYECVRCEAKIPVGETYLLHQEKVHSRYYTKKKYCIKCMTEDQVKLKHTRNVRENRPCAGEIWVVDMNRSGRTVIKLSSDYYKDRDYTVFGNSSLFNTREDPVIFIRKVFIDD